MTASLAPVVLAAPLAFATAAAVAARAPGPRSRRVERAVTAASWVGVAAAAGGVAIVATAGPQTSGTIGAAGLGLSVRLDPVSAGMLAMIALLAAVIVRYSATYMDGDARHGAFLGWLAATVAAVELLVCSGNLAMLVATWVATSLALHRLLVFYRSRRGAVIAARKRFLVARLGDGFLLAAAVSLYRELGTGDLGEIFAAVGERDGQRFGASGVGLAALCLAVAALLKSAQFPTHGWLVEVMETPTPVSALLHAGILNAGPFLLIRMSPVLDGEGWASVVLIGVGGATALFASVALLTQPTVKVALGYSSAAHMGFMALVCGLGIYPAALLHLVAHSFYKAHAFLSSGSVVDEARAPKPALPPRLGHPGRLLLATAGALGCYLGFALVLAPGALREPELAALGAVLVLGLVQLLAPVLDSAGPVSGTVRVFVAAAGVTAAFFTLEAITHHLVHGVVPEPAARAVPALVLAATVLGAFAIVVALQIAEPARAPSRRRRRWAVHLRNGLYANAWADRLVGALRQAPATPVRP